MTERERRRARKGPFKGKGADSREARREAPARRRETAPVTLRRRAGNPATNGGHGVTTVSADCGKRSRRLVQGWTLIGSVAVRTTNLPLAARAAAEALRIIQPEGHCRIGQVRLRWMRLAQFYRYIGAVP